MSDDTELNGTEPTVPLGAPVVAAPKGSSGDFLSTTAGKAVLIAGAVLVLLVIAGVVGWFVLGPSSLSGTGTTGAPTVLVPAPATTTVPSAATTSTTSSTVATLPPADITSRDVFTPRNPFTVIKPAVIATSTTTTHTTVDPNTLVVSSITTVGGVRKAVLLYGGNTYTLAAGELVPGTSDWKVVKVNTSSVDMLFGDVPVNLKAGQTSTK